MCIFDCLVEEDCYFPSFPEYILGEDVICNKATHKIKICGKDLNSNQCVYKCQNNKALLPDNPLVIPYSKTSKKKAALKSWDQIFDLNE